MDTFELNTENLCRWKENVFEDRLNNANHYANMVLKDWRNTNSPFWNYWGQMIYDASTNKATDAFKKYILPLGKENSFNFAISP